jgi:hypothetical protein
MVAEGGLGAEDFLRAAEIWETLAQQADCVAEIMKELGR